MKLKGKLKTLANAVSSIEKQFGQGAVMFLGDAPTPDEIPSFHSGSLGLDRALGTGGYPRGRLIEIYGPESSGKTTLTLHAIAEVHKQGGVAAFIDAEHALDVTYAKKLGVDVDRLLVSQPDYGEQALEIVDTLIRSDEVDLVVIDSVAALVPKAELDGEIGDQQVGLQARMMSKAMRMLTGITHRTGSTVMFINQIRQKIGVQFGSPETTTGGNALKFYASVRLDVRRFGQVKQKDAENAVGARTRVKVVKNKMAPPFRKAEFEIRYGEGIHREAELIDLGAELGVLNKSGAHIAFDDERIGYGRDKTIARLRAEPDLAARIEEQIRSADATAEASLPQEGESEAA
jgi:recombination protein RecA